MWLESFDDNSQKQLDESEKFSDIQEIKLTKMNGRMGEGISPPK